MKQITFPAFLALIVLELASSIAIAHEINRDHCNRATFSADAISLGCDRKYLKFKSKGLPVSDHQ